MSRRKHDNDVQWRVFRCCTCGNPMLYPKYDARRRTARGHPKHVWCYRCKRRTLHKQIS